MKLIRHGDVVLKEVNQSMNGATTYETLRLAEGEATGHHHTLYPQGGRVRELFVGTQRFIELDCEALLRHQEHKELRIEPGTYEIVIEREWDYIENQRKQVVD